MHSGKTPGSDGFPVEYYQIFCSLLLAPLRSMFKAAIATGCFPRDLDLATIVVLHKQGRPLEHCPSYWPISLINCKPELYDIMLANCVCYQN